VIGCLLIRADADTQIGSGHLMRCLALAQAWQGDGGSVTFLGHCDNDALRRRIETDGLSFVSIDKPHPDSSDLRKTLVLLDKLAGSHRTEGWLVLDGYHFDSDYQGAIRAAGHRLLVVDDMSHLTHYHADVVLNQNIHAERLNYHCDADTKLLLGTDYVMLRTEFQSRKGWRREISNEAHKVLVSLGGGDADNVTLKVVQALQQSEINDLEARIIVGPANPHLQSLREAAASSGNLELLLNITNMPELIAWADVAVSSGGSTCWELAFMGLPSLAIVLAENQAGIARGLNEARAAIDLGWHQRVSTQELTRKIDSLLKSFELRQEMSKRGRSLVDADGASRVVEALRSRTRSTEHAHSFSGQ
jgi:UDP-2,4-diacetamido-2,4,6-trideoxy-beta-L-altropyranose hydrolase